METWVPGGCARGVRRGGRRGDIKARRTQSRRRHGRQHCTQQGWQCSTQHGRRHDKLHNKQHNRRHNKQHDRQTASKTTRGTIGCARSRAATCIYTAHTPVDCGLETRLRQLEVARPIPMREGYLLLTAAHYYHHQLLHDASSHSLLHLAHQTRVGTLQQCRSNGHRGEGEA
jgi:hypothetical protein